MKYILKNKYLKKGTVIQKRTRGYRLKPATHLLIVKIQELMKSDQDAAIACACSMFYAELRKTGRTELMKRVS